MTSTTDPRESSVAESNSSVTVNGTQPKQPAAAAMPSQAYEQNSLSTELSGLVLSSGASTANPFRFMDIYPELRLQVYHHIVDSLPDISVRHGRTLLKHPLALVSKQISDESIDVYKKKLPKSAKVVLLREPVIDFNFEAVMADLNTLQPTPHLGQREVHVTLRFHDTTTIADPTVPDNALAR
jgi:hypothetical protein